MKKESNIITLLITLSIPLFIGSLSSLISGNSIVTFQQLEQPPLSPPGWLFPIVWTILFILMGIASYLIVISDSQSQEQKEQIKKALTLYGLQLIVNFFWSPIFFVGEFYLFAFIWLMLLWALIVCTIKAFYQISPPAALLMLPYLLWVTFAGYLNLMIYFLN